MSFRESGQKVLVGARGIDNAPGTAYGLGARGKSGNRTMDAVQEGQRGEGYELLGAKGLAGRATGVCH
jgi:hypothetical protein